jgi:hypothetical protein
MTCHFASLKNMILTATFVLLPMAAVNVSAQNAAQVNVPFAFMANHQSVPAGYYKVLSTDDSLTLVDAKTGRPEAMFLVRHESGSAIESKGMLTFKSSGGRHILIEAQFAGSSTHSRLLVQPKQERLSANQSTSSATTVELAMK